MNSIQITTLDNGITIVTDSMEQVETATVGVWVGTGTRYETPEINGISHMLEHMAFKGTARRSARDIAEEIEAVGGHLNAYTARETTAYFAKVMKPDVALALDIIGDILLNSQFEADELAREREVVLQELGQAEDTPDDIVFDHFQSAAFPDQPLGRPVLGTEETVMAMNRDVLMAHMRRFYCGRRMFVAAAGKVEHVAVLEQAARLFGGVPAGQPASPVPGRYAGGEFRNGEELEQAHIVLGFPGIPIGHADKYAMAALSTILGGGMSSRLFQEVREKRGLVYSIYSFHNGFADCGLFGIYAGTGDKSIPEVMPLVFDELAGIVGRIKPQELARAKAQLKADVLMSLESTSARAEQAARHLMYYGRIVPVAESVAEIDAVDDAALKRCIETILAGPLTVAALGPVASLESYAQLGARLGR